MIQLSWYERFRLGRRDADDSPNLLQEVAGCRRSCRYVLVDVRRDWRGRGHGLLHHFCYPANVQQLVQGVHQTEGTALSAACACYAALRGLIRETSFLMA